MANKIVYYFITIHLLFMCFRANMCSPKRKTHTTEENTMKKHCINFAQTTTIENLAEFIRPCYGAVLNFNGKVLVTNLNWKGQYEAATYEFFESPDETGLSECECRLNLVNLSDQTFKDSGNAIAWCMAH